MSRTQAEWEARESEIRYWKRERRAALNAGRQVVALECEAMLASLDVMESEYEGGAL